MRNDYAKERRIKEMYLSGMTTQQIADEYGVSYQTIVYFLKKNGVERRGFKKYHYKEISKMIDDYQNGMTLKAVGEKYGVLIQFSDGTHNVEVLPAYEMYNREFLIPNTENGGSWNVFDPRTPIKSFQDSNQSSNSLTQELTKMIKAWKRNTSTLEYKSYRIAEDVTTFVNNIYPDGADTGSYLSVIKNFFTYIFNRISSTDARYSHINTAKTRVDKAYQYEEDGKHIEASEELRKVFGDVFPKEEENDDNTKSIRSFTNAPSPWRV